MATRILWRAAVMALLWWAITEGQPGAWLFGLPVILIAVLGSLALRPARPMRWRPLGVLRLVSFFLRESVIGGIDVARRALHPRMPLRPAVLDLALRLPRGPGRVLVVDMLSLLPGTLSADLHAGRVRVHALDSTLPVERTLRVLEDHVAASLGLHLADTPHT